MVRRRSGLPRLLRPLARLGGRVAGRVARMLAAQRGDPAVLAGGPAGAADAGDRVEAAGVEPVPGTAAVPAEVAEAIRRASLLDTLGLDAEVRLENERIMREFPTAADLSLTAPDTPILPAADDDPQLPLLPEEPAPATGNAAEHGPGAAPDGEKPPLP